MRSNSQRNNRDILGIKLLKFWQVIFMIVFHSMAWSMFSGHKDIYHENSSLFIIMSKNYYLGFFNLTIPLTASMTFYLSQETHLRGRVIENFPMKHIFSLTMTFLVLESIINIMSYGTGEIFSWEVLKFLALSFILLTFISRASIDILLPLGVLIWWITPILRGLVPGQNDYLSGVLFGNHGFHFSWPFFPWFGLCCISYFSIFIYRQVRESIYGIFGLWITGSIFLLIFYLFLYDDYPISEILFWKSIFQPPQKYFFALLGFHFLFLSLCLFFGSYWPPRHRGVTDCFAQGILPIYVVHSLIGPKIAIFLKGFETLSLTEMIILLSLILILISWFVGYVSITFMKDKRLVIRLRKITNKTEYQDVST